MVTLFKAAKALIRCLRLKKKVRLAGIAEYDHQNGRQYLRRRGVPMEVIYKKFQEKEIKQHADQHNENIPHQLMMPL